MTDLITISSSVLPPSARVLSFRGFEAISRPYELEIFISMQEGSDELDLLDAVGAKAQLVIDRTDDKLPPYVFAGVFARVDLLHAIEDRVLLRAVLVPRLWLMSLSRHSRLFTKQSLPEIIEEVLTENGVTDYELRLGSYEKEEHICQYRESDLDFLSRWMEREGIYYFFAHSEEGETLIIADSKNYEDDALGFPVRYYPQLGQDRSAGPSLRSFTSRHHVLPASIRLRDYDYARPNLAIAGSADVTPNGVGEVSFYGERFFSPSMGTKLAKTRAEELKTREVLFQGAGTRTHLRTGHSFTLEEHPRGAFNTKYLAVEIRHFGNQAAFSTHFREIARPEHDEVYFVEVDAIPADVQFRAESRTQWPRIYGHENGIVDGPAESEYAQIDAQGRYNVRFNFDESSLGGGKASTFVRMMQPHGGGVEGFHFPLRKGTEVVFSFLGGDPDRPVIAGVVPNALTPSAVTSGNHTKNVIQTGGRNRLELEDKAGQQWINLSTPYSNTHLRMGSPQDGHELILHTDDNAHLDVGKNFDLDVGHQGGGSWNAKINNDWITHVETGKHELFVDAGTSLTKVKGNTNLQVTNGNYQVDVDSGMMFVNVQSNYASLVKAGNYFLNVAGGNAFIDVSGETNIYSKGKLQIKTDASCEFLVKSNMTVSVDGSVAKEIKGAEEVTTHGPFKKLYSSNNVNITGGMKSDTFLGLSNSNAVGASVSTFLGAKATLECSAAFTATFAVKLDITNGASLAYKMGIAATVNAAVEFTAKPVKARQYGVVVGIMGNKIINHLIKLETAATHIIT